MKSSPGRNTLCPCGSGKKFKRCCSGVGDSRSPQEFASLSSRFRRARVDTFTDPERQMVGVVANDFLSRTLQRDCPAIATAFDEDFAEELREMTVVLASDGRARKGVAL